MNSLQCSYLDFDSDVYQLEGWDQNALKLAAKHANIMDNMPDHKLTSLLSSSTEYKASYTSKNFADTYYQFVLKALDDKCFDFLRNDDRFLEINKNLK